MSVDEGGRAPETLLCPACGSRCADPRALAVHSERHRPVDPPTNDRESGREISHPCSAGCGRNFLSLAQYREHAPICDGQRPLEPFLDNRNADSPRGKAMECPECRVPHGDVEGLSVHLERHREVLPPSYDPSTKELMSRPCPKDCGRHFLSKREYKEHSELCDGSKPLPTGRAEEPLIVIDDPKPAPDAESRKEGERGMLTCNDCDPPRKFTHEAWYAKHLKKVHGKKYEPEEGAAAPRERKPRSAPAGSDAVRPAAAAAPSPAGSAEISVPDLKQKAIDLRRRADRLEEIAAAVDLLVKEAQTLL